ncbi:hypothetical protein WR25_07714 isoform B [Diploscapter pachys]|uniref:Neurotransmitter-gated ion-channel ligand-binding domain-containing protein n=1 Tax=Diploscapter pachys TaxID=2018661 RepID=A0A2A2L1N6_9BILA|nr:hypothetical protein WR25_07714 isoform B [Diploscapter pachys]
MILIILLAILSECILAKRGVWAGDQERRLYAKLEEGYNKLARPVKNDSEPVLVMLGLDYQQILDVSWIDNYLVSHAEKTDLHRILDLGSSGIRNGNITWIPPAIIRSSCSIDIELFPFDTQHCSMKFGSWTYSGFFTDLLNSTVSAGTYKPNGEWELLGLTSTRSIFYYDCCPEPYYDVTFTISIRRRTLYYGFNFVLPSMLISALALLSFTLPADCGEKLNLCVTIFMSLCVFMLMVAEAMPQTSDSLPLIEVYFSCIMFEVGASVVATVFALNLHHRCPESYVPMGPWTRKILLEILPAILGIERPELFDVQAHNYENLLDERRKKLRASQGEAVVPILKNFTNNYSTIIEHKNKAIHLDLTTNDKKVSPEKRPRPHQLPGDRSSYPIANSTLISLSPLNNTFSRIMAINGDASNKTPVGLNRITLDERQYHHIIDELKIISTRVRKEVRLDQLQTANQ